ncbi:uncharacterized protein LOC124410098 [Diprion similis]|uniref:uncharacterized protein LOC124410098 n=1 Tax=Diprion similis TaxID=362088 RepID=UPI001EF7A7BB|nr:uncharacterized protein LOC124410098 [Diprion similis]
MFKLIVLFAFLAVVMAQDPPGQRKPPAQPLARRVARQAGPPMPPMPPMPGGSGQVPPSSGSSDVTKLVDPSTWINKGKEMMSQVGSGRRRRNV